MPISRLAATRCLGAVLAAALICSGTAALRAASTADTPRVAEYPLKAAFISKFPQFVTWPPPAWTGRADFAICVLEPNPFGTALHDVVAGDSVNERPIVIRTVTADALGGCHVLFVPAGAPARENVLNAVRGQPVLTIGDAPGFLDDGGILDLQLVDGHVRFEVDVDAASRAGLTVSSQLLRLAVRVRRAHP